MNQFQRNNNQNQTIENWQVYSAVGRIKTNTITRGSETYVEEYKYDLRGRLEKVLKDGVEQVGYTFDNNSNRLTETRGGNTIDGVYDAQDRLKTYGDLTFSYTDNGDVKRKVHLGGTDTYHYDAFGSMKQVDLANGKVITYKMDARDRRVAKLVDGVVVQRMIYKDQLNPIAILDSENNVETLFVYGSKSNVPNYMIKGGEKYKYITDHKGSVLQVIKMSDGSVAQDISYDFWGNVLSDTSPGFQPGWAEPVLGLCDCLRQPTFYYVGGLYDVDTKLIKFGVRSYDPEVGRWMQKEPLGFAGALNFYSYCEGEPVNWVDVTGLKSYAAVWIWEKSWQSGGSFMGHASLQINDYMYDYDSDGVDIYSMKDYMAGQERNAKRIKLNLTDEQIEKLGIYFLVFGQMSYDVLNYSCVTSITYPLRQSLEDTGQKPSKALKRRTLIPANLPLALIDAGISEPRIGIFKGKPGKVQRALSKVPVIGGVLDLWLGGTL